jgi:hypothetical protein
MLLAIVLRIIDARNIRQRETSAGQSSLFNIRIRQINIPSLNTIRVTRLLRYKLPVQDLVAQPV